MPLTQRAFELHTPFQPTGDQPQAIEALTRGVMEKREHQVLLGVTGSGKTFTMANVIARVQRPALVLCHNKTLAAQLFSEFREFFPNNAVEYFVSYYDYYQPEAYIPSTDTFIEKDSQVNEEIDKLRHSATRSLFDRSDVLIVSSISCIYGLGSPEAYEGHLLVLDKGQKIKRQEVLRKLVEIQYQRNDIDFHRGTFRVRGDTIEVFPAYEEDRALRIEFFDEEVESLCVIDPLRGLKLENLNRITVYPGSHYVASLESRNQAMSTIRDELRERLIELNSLGKLVEAQRLSQRTLYDLEMMEQMGFCQGIENYSRHMTGRPAGAAPPTLLEYFPKNDWLLFVDESHVTVPQIGGMYRGDRARKSTLVEHGFRLPSALDNRPLNFEEWENTVHQVVYVSATPGEYELRKTGGEVVEQVIRPTGLLDPVVEVRPALNQVDDLYTEILKRIDLKERVLVTTLTKKLAEDLSSYFQKKNLKVKYLHSDIETLERIEILRDLRLGVFDVLIGINLLREGLDLPEVSLVAILDADKEGFLRSTRSLIQTIGRAARNSRGLVILYADRITESMRVAMDETSRRRTRQMAYNKEHGITPTTIQKAIRSGLQPFLEADMVQVEASQADIEILAGEFFKAGEDPLHLVARMDQTMRELAQRMEFEKAAEIRDRIKKLKSKVL